MVSIRAKNVHMLISETNIKNVPSPVIVIFKENPTASVYQDAILTGFAVRSNRICRVSSVRAGRSIQHT
jgi:hypothetical protein